MDQASVPAGPSNLETVSQLLTPFAGQGMDGGRTEHVGAHGQPCPPPGPVQVRKSAPSKSSTIIFHPMRFASNAAAASSVRAVVMAV